MDYELHYIDVQAIFQRYPRPEKECQSFSLIYSDRSLDLVRIAYIGICCYILMKLSVAICSLNRFLSLYNPRSRVVFLLVYQICKDKDEAEVWFAGLKTLISRSHQRKWRTESRSDGVSSGTHSPRTYTRRSSPLSSPFGSTDSIQKVL